MSKMDCTNSKDLTSEDLCKVVKRDDYSEYVGQEYEEIIHMKVEGTFDASTSAGNLNKAGKPILCYDHNRVVVSEEDDGSSSYIDASYISGYKHPKTYICTRTPSALTFGIFWRMVYENKTELIVMLDSLVGNSDLYWSRTVDGTLQFGKLTIKTLKIQSHLDIQMTKLELTHEDGEKWEIDHFLYQKNWVLRDVKYPEISYIAFMRMTRLYYKGLPDTEEDCPPRHKSPMIVHCRTGTGRAVTFCGIDICISRFLETGTVNIFSTFSQLRKERYDCLFNINQYFFFYSALYYYFTTNPQT